MYPSLTHTICVVWILFRHEDGDIAKSDSSAVHSPFKTSFLFLGHGRRSMLMFEMTLFIRYYLAA